MLLKEKVAFIYGAGGAVGGAVARTFAHEGARLFLSGRHRAGVAEVAKEIQGIGGSVDVAEVDALDGDAVEKHMAAAVKEAGRGDVVFNAMGFAAAQGVPLVDLEQEDFSFPIRTWTTTQFLTSRAAARRMMRQRSGVILTLSASPARSAVALTGGFGVACAAIEGLTRTLAAEVAPYGVRVVCIRPHRIDETIDAVQDFPLGREKFRTTVEGMTLLKRLPTLDEVARTAAFLASDHAAAMTGSVANLTAGMSVD